MADLSCASCFQPLDACTCASAAQPTQTYEAPASSTTCTGFINRDGRIEHTADCPIHGAIYRPPADASWYCGYDEDGDDEPCEGTSFYCWIGATARTSASVQIDVDGSHNPATYEQIDHDYDTYGAEIDDDSLEFDDLELINCALCDREFYFDSPQYKRAMEALRTLNL